MNENPPSEDEPVSPSARRTITITLPSRATVGAGILGLILVVSSIVGGVWGYRHLQHRQNVDSARSEMAAMFKERQAKAATLLEVAGRDAAQLGQDMSGALMATQSAAIVPEDFAGREQGLATDLAAVQKILAGLADEEKNLVQRKKLSPADTVFSQENQEQFNALQKQWQDLNTQNTQLLTLLQDVTLRKESLVVAEKRAASLVAAQKMAQARAKAQAQARTARLRQQQTAPAVFGAPAYYNYSNRYYTAPIYGPNYYPRYGGAYGSWYGSGW